MFKLWLILSLFLVFMTGCNEGTDEAYNESFQNGLDYIAAEDFIRAEVHLEQALEARPDDERAINLISQIQHYMKAMEYYNLEEYDATIDELDYVIHTDNGSSGLVAKAQDMIDRVELTMDEITALIEADTETEALLDADKEAEGQPEETEDETITDQSNILENQVEAAAAEEMESAISSTVDTDPETVEYHFEDFHGYFANFEGEPYYSELVHLIILTDSKYYDLVIGWGEFAGFNIVNYEVNANNLFIEYEPESEEGGMELFPGSANYTLTNSEDNYKQLINQNGFIYYALTAEDFFDTGLNPDIGELGNF